MALDLSAWNPLDHPRDRHGRFRDKWSLSDAVKQVFRSVMSGFSPATFRSDAHAQAYLDGSAKARDRRLSTRQRASIDYFMSPTSHDGMPGWKDINSSLDANAGEDMPRSGTWTLPWPRWSKTCS